VPEGNSYVEPARGIFHNENSQDRRSRRGLVPTRRASPARRMTAAIDVQHFINARPVSGYQRLILFLCFLVVALDGFDTALVGFIAPAIQSEWAIGAARLTPLMMAGLGGLLIGAFGFGPLSDRLGRRPVLLVTTGLFGIMTIASGFAASIEQLTALRFLTGLGLGGAMPNALTLCAEYSPDRRRATLLTLMFCGFTVGMASSGFIAAAVIPTLGWRWVLYLGGLAPLVLVPLLALLPESSQFLVLKGGRDRQIARNLGRLAPHEDLTDAIFVTPGRASGAPVRQIFAEGLARGTLLMWCAFFMSLLIVYLVGNWLPLILTGTGVGKSTAALVTTGFHVGGTAGALVWGRLMDRFDENRVLAAAYGLAALVIVAVGLASHVLWVVAAGLVAIGFCVSGGQVGLNALSSGFYPTAARGTGVSWANGVGRIGSIFGSFVGGSLIALGWSAGTIFLLLAVPAILGSLAMVLLGRFRAQRAG
jgi:AAHS family 4-hydroxybenzoate transporter-like MFS transporter